MASNTENNNFLTLNSPNKLKKRKLNDGKEEKREIEDLISTKSDRIKFVEENLIKSDVWKRFKAIFLDENKTNFIKCNNCPKLYKYDDKMGTSNLLRHKCTSTAKSFG